MILDLVWQLGDEPECAHYRRTGLTTSGDWVPIAPAPEDHNRHRSDRYNFGGKPPESRDDSVLLTVMLIFVALTVVVNFVAILGLLKGRQTRSTLLKGLLRMYEDQGVSGYYDLSLLGIYSTRYSLFILAVVITRLISISVPFVVR